MFALKDRELGLNPQSTCKERLMAYSGTALLPI